MIDTDAERGLLRVQAGATWPAVIATRLAMRAPGGGTWAIRPQQTGVDDVTPGGSNPANAHGRGLAMRPRVDDIEDRTLIDANGERVRCIRTENAELFSLAAGG